MLHPVILRNLNCNQRLEENKMPEVILKTDKPKQVSEVIKEALEIEKARVEYSLNLTLARLSRFEDKYRVLSTDFIRDCSSEDLTGGDMEYVEWAGEYRFSQNLKDRLNTLKSIEYVSS